MCEKANAQMFLISRAEDSVEIRAAEEDKKEAVLRTLKRKYQGKTVENEGVVMAIGNIACSDLFVAYAEKLVSSVNFQVLFFRPFQGEICSGKIVKQDEEGITVANTYFSTFFVAETDLFDGCEFVAGGRAGHWVWNYRGNPLSFANNAQVLLQVKNCNWRRGVVECAMNDQGLGPVSWWV